jgi:Putative serine dehydratase domain
VVADVFGTANFVDAVDIVLRPGCYLTHDAGMYREAQTKITRRNSIADQMRTGLLPALQVWAYVQSIPEQNNAIVAMGKRDAAFDAGFPSASLHYRPGDVAPKAAAVRWKLTRMMDQHAYMQIAREDDLRVGDMIAFAISHPCLSLRQMARLTIPRCAISRCRRDSHILLSHRGRLILNRFASCRVLAQRKTAGVKLASQLVFGKCSRFQREPFMTNASDVFVERV